MSCKVTFESIIKFRDYDLLLKLDTSSINVEFYSLSNGFYFIILCYIEQKIYFLWRPAISRFKCPKKFWPAGDCWHLKVGTLKVKGNSTLLTRRHLTVFLFTHSTHRIEMGWGRLLAGSDNELGR